MAWHQATNNSLLQPIVTRLTNEGTDTGGGIKLLFTYVPISWWVWNYLIRLWTKNGWDKVHDKIDGIISNENIWDGLVHDGDISCAIEIIRIHNTFVVVDRYLRRMGDKTIPDEAPPSLESFNPPWVAGIDLPQQRCCGFFVSFTNKHK